MSTTKVSIPGEVFVQDGLRLTTPSTGPVVLSGAGDPITLAVVATKGSLFVNTATAQLWQHNGTTWVQTGTGGQASCAAYASANQSIANATNTPIVYDKNLYDTASMHSETVNNTKLFAPFAGRYLVTVGVEFAADSNGMRYLKIRKTDAVGSFEYALVTAKGVTTYTSAMIASTVIDMAAGDYVEAVVYQDSGVNLNVLGATYNTIAMCRQAGYP